MNEVLSLRNKSVFLWWNIWMIRASVIITFFVLASVFVASIQRPITFLSHDVIVQAINQQYDMMGKTYARKDIAGFRYITDPLSSKKQQGLFKEVISVKTKNGIEFPTVIVPGKVLRFKGKYFLFALKYFCLYILGLLLIGNLTGHVVLAVFKIKGKEIKEQFK